MAGHHASIVLVGFVENAQASVNELSRISDEEMKRLMKEIVNKRSLNLFKGRYVPKG